MLRSIDGKSFLIGGLLVLAAVSAMGGVSLMDGQYNGRFSLVAQDTDHGGVYVIDTITGQVWVRDYQGGRTFYALNLEGTATKNLSSRTTCSRKDAVRCVSTWIRAR